MSIVEPTLIFSEGNFIFSLSSLLLHPLFFNLKTNIYIIFYRFTFIWTEVFFNIDKSFVCIQSSIKLKFLIATSDATWSLIHSQHVLHMHQCVTLQLKWGQATIFFCKERFQFFFARRKSKTRYILRDHSNILAFILHTKHCSMLAPHPLQILYTCIYINIFLSIYTWKLI